MSLLRVAAPLASLIFFSAFALGQIVAPSCTLAAYEWAFNSLGQSPCDVTANMMGTCNGGRYNFSALPQGYHYVGPRGSQNSNLCYCSTVGYSLYSACGACQGRIWIGWSEWVTNCTKTLPASSFPNPVPSGIRLPHWALLDITNENNWNPNKSYAAGNSPELGPGSVLSPSGVSESVTPTSSFSASSSAFSTTTVSPTPPPPGVGSSSNTGAIAGGAVGGVAAILIAIFAIFYLRRRSRVPSAVSSGVGAPLPERPLSDAGTLASSSLPVSPVAMKFYDPNDSTMFPVPSHIGSGSTLAYTQPSRPQDRGYHGLPMV